MDFDLSAITSKLAIVLPYLSYIVNMLKQLFGTAGDLFNS